MGAEERKTEVTGCHCGEGGVRYCMIGSEFEHVFTKFTRVWVR